VRFKLFLQQKQQKHYLERETLIKIFPEKLVVVLNSNTELLFNGVAPPRAFSFSFDLVPRSEAESKVIKDIILFFKKESAAQKGAERVRLLPDYFLNHQVYSNFNI
jgi:hypothetical protein